MATARKRNETDQEIDEALEGFMDAMGPKMKVIFMFVLLCVVFYVFMWPSRETWGPAAIIKT
jgi:hypothetical protein